jgi:hypothetical protein
MGGGSVVAMLDDEEMDERVPVLCFPFGLWGEGGGVGIVLPIWIIKLTRYIDKSP